MLKPDKQPESFERAKERALWYLDRSSLTEKALRERLMRSFVPGVVDRVIERLIDYGFINDEDYARRYCESCMRSNISKRETVQKLYLKGIPIDLAKSTVEEYTWDMVAQIKALLQKKYSSKLNDEQSIKKVFAALLRKGFGYGDIKDALKEYSTEIEEM